MDIMNINSSLYLISVRMNSPLFFPLRSFAIDYDEMELRIPSFFIFILQDKFINTNNFIFSLSLFHRPGR
jgi:hypothetical protein